MRRIYLLTVYTIAFALSACGGGGSDGGSNNGGGSSGGGSQAVVVNFSATVNGQQSVPQVASMQSAEAQVSVSTASAVRTMTATMNLADVDSVAGAHIYAGEVGTTGAIAFSFTGPDGNGMWRIANTTITDAQYDALAAGDWYVGVQTANFPDGEIRGQIISDTQQVYTFELAGEQSVPRVSTQASGDAYVFYDSANGAFVANVLTADIEPTAAHIHSAEAGMTGDVVVGLSASTNADNLWESPEDAMLTSAEAALLASADLYVNVHTEENPNGEIRGQILPEVYALILFDLSGEQEVPAVNTAATGLGYATLNTESGGLRLNAWALNNLNVEAAHIHQATVGVNGEVFVGLEKNADIAGLWSTPVNTAVNSDVQALLLSGGHYVNMHTAAYPAGELRGQIVADPWKVIAFPLTGSQVVPPVTTTAKANGYGLVNAETGALSLLVNTVEFTNASAANVHTGIAGSNGSVAIAMEQDSTAMSTWKVPADTTLEPGVLSTFLNGGHYVNMTSATFASGEIRGQILASDTVLFPVTLTGANVAPTGVVTTATSSGAFALNQDTGALTGAINFSGVSATGAQIREGAVGANGDVVLRLVSSAQGTFKVADSTTLTQAQMDAMLSGSYYVTIVSAANADGELRAQIIQL